MHMILIFQNYTICNVFKFIHLKYCCIVLFSKKSKHAIRGFVLVALVQFLESDTIQTSSHVASIDVKPRFLLSKAKNKFVNTHFVNDSNFAHLLIRQINVDIS